MLNSRIALSVLGLTLAACGGDDDPMGGADAATDAALDAPTAGLVGTWMLLPPNSPELDIGTVTFRADGTSTLGDDPPDHGRYTVAGNRLTVDPDLPGAAHPTIETDFLLSGSQLMLPAFLPQGTPSGMLGTWKTDVVSDGIKSSTAITTNADQTAVVRFSTADSEQEIPGTWATEPTGFVFTGPNLTLHFKPFAGGAVGYTLFERQ